MRGSLSPVDEPHQHVVHFYGDDDELHGLLGEHLAKGLLLGEAVVVVTTAGRRRALEIRLRDRGISVAEARQSGALVWLDGAATLAAFMVDGRPDPGAFQREVGRVVTTAAGVGRPVRIFGEMVALLWSEGNAAGAVELEDLWNDLARSADFTLYCAYPMAGIATRDDLAATQRVCARHSHVIAPHRRSRPAGAARPANAHSEIFVPSPASVAAARTFVTDALSTWGCESALGDAALVISELATNAVRHARSAFRVVLERQPSRLRIAVHDTNPLVPVVGDRPPDEAGGLGLPLVERLSLRWGTDLHDGGKVVWCDVPLPAVADRT